MQSCFLFKSYYSFQEWFMFLSLYFYVIVVALCSCHLTIKFPQGCVLLSVCFCGSFHRLGISPLPSSSLLPWQLGCCGNTMHLGDTSFRFVLMCFLPPIFLSCHLSLIHYLVQRSISSGKNLSFLGQRALFVALNRAVFRTLIDSGWREERGKTTCDQALKRNLYLYCFSTILS